MNSQLFLDCKCQTCTKYNPRAIYTPNIPGFDFECYVPQCDPERARQSKCGNYIPETGKKIEFRRYDPTKPNVMPENTEAKKVTMSAGIESPFSYLQQHYNLHLLDQVTSTISGATSAISKAAAEHVDAFFMEFTHLCASYGFKIIEFADTEVKVLPKTYKPNIAEFEDHELILELEKRLREAKERAEELY